MVQRIDDDSFCSCSSETGCREGLGQRLSRRIDGTNLIEVMSVAAKAVALDSGASLDHPGILGSLFLRPAQNPVPISTKDASGRSLEQPASQSRPSVLPTLFSPHLP